MPPTTERSDPRERTGRRFPQWVYGVGEEPDPRFSLANERTFLAWVRTALALIAAGVAVEALPLDLDPQLRVVTAAVFVLLGIVAGGRSWFGWARTERSVRLATALPGAGMSAVVATIPLDLWPRGS